MTENWKTHFSKRNKINVMIMKLSKSFHTLNYNLLVVEFKTYGVDSDAALFIKSYHTNRYQHCKTGDSFSEWERIILGVPEEFILGPISFNILINNIYLFIKNSELCNYDDDVIIL